MVSYEQMNSNNETSLKYDLMHDYEFARLLKEPGVKVMDAYVHLVFDTDVISSEEIIFATNEIVSRDGLLLNNFGDQDSQNDDGNNIVRLEPCDDLRHNIPVRYVPGNKTGKPGGNASFAASSNPPARTVAPNMNHPTANK